jgi:spectinomycin phosphotransferase/16S rRNA (guanine(1405)-N(7))-methyltransferase
VADRGANRLAGTAPIRSLIVVLSPPEAVSEAALASALARAWRRSIGSLTYRPVGFGSHHWDGVDATGRRWWVTVDDLETKRVSRLEPDPAAFDRLHAALAAAAALREHGRPFAVAPVVATDGRYLVPIDDRYAVALYPYVDGQRFSWGEFSTPEHRRATLDMVLGVHTAPASVRGAVRSDDFAIAHADELESTLDGDGATAGPYARPMVDLVAAHARALRRHLDTYRELVAQARAGPDRAVLTHGEPHPGNTMRTADGWVLIDWETALVAPPERDLWLVDPGDGSVLAAYAEASGRPALAPMVDLYRLRWALSDIAIEVARFRRPHDGGAEDDASWEILAGNVAALTR